MAPAKSSAASRGAKAKGLSMEEKCDRIRDFLVEKAMPLSVKEIETACYRATGVVSQSVKEVLGILVAEGRISSEKAGVSQYYWCFPGVIVQKLQDECDALVASIAAAKNRVLVAEKRLTAAQIGREATPHRERLVKATASLSAQKAELTDQLRSLDGCSTVTLGRLHELRDLAQTAVVMENDNSLSAIQYLLDIREEAAQSFCSESNQKGPASSLHPRWIPVVTSDVQLVSKWNSLCLCLDCILAGDGPCAQHAPAEVDAAADYE